MERLYFVICLFFGIGIFNTQKIKFQTLLIDDISIRALEIWDGKVWYSGTNSKFGYVSLSDNLDKKQIKTSDKRLQFRTLAQNKTHFYLVNIESPAYFFKVDKKTLLFENFATDSSKTAFYDAIHFVDDRRMYAFSDPDENHNLKLKFMISDTKKDVFIATHHNYKLSEGEAAFAASNTNIASYKNAVWVATGGKKSRILKSTDGTKFEFIDIPFVQGTSSQGIYSIDFYNENFGIAVGGDYTKQNSNINNIATTEDGGKTWKIQASGKNAGYSTCVKIRPHSKGKDIIAIGDQHISISHDFGKTWKKISDAKGFYTFQWVDKQTIILAGKNKIVKATIVRMEN